MKPAIAQSLDGQSPESVSRGRRRPDWTYALCSGAAGGVLLVLLNLWLGAWMAQPVWRMALCGGCSGLVSSFAARPLARWLRRGGKT